MMENRIDQNKTYINIEIKTWDKDSNGLYDYYSKNIKEVSQIFDEKMDIIRKYQDINFRSSYDLDNNDIEDENILKINKEEEEYVIENDLEKNMEQNNENIDKINKKLYYVVNNNDNNNQDNQNRNKNYYLIKNDLIKVGRSKLILTETHIFSGDKKFELTVPQEDSSSVNIKNSQSDPAFNLIKEAIHCPNNNNSEDKIVCKICFSEQTDVKTNPLIHLCKCKNDISFIHYKCLKRWMRTKLYIYENKKKTVRTYFIPRFNCEICLEPYPYKFKFQNENKIYDLIDIPKPRNNHIVLESLNQIKDNKYNNKYIHVINLVNEDDIYLGRGIDADIRINDISVSRLHSALKFSFEKKTLLIKDLKSKFGTTVLIRNSVELKKNENLNLQVGRSFISTHVMIKETFGNLDDKELTSEEINENEIKLKEGKKFNDEFFINSLNNIENKFLISNNNKFIINLENEMNPFINTNELNSHNNNIDGNFHQ